jgi:hypothetical protein
VWGGEGSSDPRNLPLEFANVVSDFYNSKNLSGP